MAARCDAARKGSNVIFVQPLSYTLARVSAAQVEEEERRYATQLQHYFWVQEEDYKSQGVWQAAPGPHARGALP